MDGIRTHRIVVSYSFVPIASPKIRLQKILNSKKTQATSVWRKWEYIHCLLHGILDEHGCYRISMNIIRDFNIIF